ncbi:MAG: DNA methyltransferase, partial [bacterium]
MAIPLFKIPEINDCFSDTYQIVVHCGDAFDFLTTIPSEIMTLIITSPPYNLGKEYENRTQIQNYLKVQDKTIAELVRVLK